MWYFPPIQSKDGWIQPRILRLDQSGRDLFNMTFGGGLGNPTNVPMNPYLWEQYFPWDCIYLDRQKNSDIINYNGDIEYNEADELLIIQLGKTAFDFIDKGGFSGKDGTGALIPWQELFQYGYSLSQLIFNDKTISTDYILWTTKFKAVGGGAILGGNPGPTNSPGHIVGVPDNYLRVTFTGDINKDTMPDQPIVLRNESNPSNLLRIPIIHLECTPIFTRLEKYSMRDLIWNHWQDGNKSIGKPDTDGYNAPTHPNCKAFVAGFKAKGDSNIHIADFLNASGFDPTGVNKDVPDNFNIAPAINYGAGLGAQEWIGTENYQTWRNFAPLNNGGSTTDGIIAVPPHAGFTDLTKTVTGCDPTSFRNGWYPISIRQLIKRMASWCSCDPSILAQIDSRMTGISAKFNDANNGYDAQTVSRFNSLDLDTKKDFVTIWNIIFGIDPQGIAIRGAGIGTDHSVFGTKTSTSATNAIRVYTTYLEDVLYGHQSDMDFVDGMEVFIEGAADPNANGMWTIGNVSFGTNWEGIRQVEFDLMGSLSSLPVAPVQGTVNKLFQTPVTYAAQDKFLAFIKNVLWQFVMDLKFPITQSGPFIGMPYMKFTPMWQPGVALPLNADGSQKWTNGTKFDKQARKITSDCIKISQLGSPGYAICPSDGKLTPIEIPPLRWNTHQYGTANAIYPPNLVYDGPNGKNLFNENDVSYGYTPITLSLLGHQTSIAKENLSGQGWIPGSYLYSPYEDLPNSNTHLPLVWNPWADINAPFASRDWSAAYALQALMHGKKTFTYGETVVPAPNQFNPLFDIARIAAMKFTVNKEMVVRDFTGLTTDDDPMAYYEDAWQEGGNMVYYRMGNHTYNQIYLTIPYSEWQASPVDANGNLNYDDLTNAPQVTLVNTYGGIGGGTNLQTGGGGGNNNNNNNNNLYRQSTREVLLYSGGTIQKTFAQVEVFEWYDTINSRWVAQYGMMPQIEPQGTPQNDTYGMNLFIQFHYKGPEFGNCYIDGLSPTGPNVTDYWFSALCMVKRQGDSDVDSDTDGDTNVNYAHQFIQWSEDLNQWIFIRPLETPNPNRRIPVWGRFQCTWDAVNLKFTNFVWKTLTSPDYQFSDDECKSDTDLGITGATRSAPIITGQNGTASIFILWGARFRPVAIQGKGWFNYMNSNTDVLIADPIEVEFKLNPIRNGQDAAGANPNSIKITWNMNDFVAVGAHHKQEVVPADITLIMTRATNSYPVALWHVEFQGLLAPMGDNATDN
jgi:hypothetical protein